MGLENEAVLVEFIGLTGAGKTTIVTAVSEVLTRRGFLVRDAYEAILTACGLNFVENPILRSVLIDVLVLWPFLGHLTTEGGWRLFRFVVRIIKRDAGSFLMAANLLRNAAKRIGVHIWLRDFQRRSNRCDFVICDEGILHSAHGLFVHVDSAPDHAEVVLFGTLAPKPDAIIWVRAPKEQSIACILQRGHSRVENSTAASRAFVEHGTLVFDALCSVESIQDKLLAVDNRIDAMATDDTVQGMALVVTRFLESRRLDLRTSG